MDETSPIHPTSVGRRLEILREYRGKTKAEFADSVQIDRTSYGKIEKGIKPLKADMAYKIAERWGVSMDYLYRGRLTEIPDSLADNIIKNLTHKD
ncbi:helix-turn-helix transcriptional regulator [Roseobacter sp. TSBP12]|uniref:helix-turn-helix domain-containing protein n=1 Tax=Roseobacter sp. TSBP12 TaxID=1236613 RepID=UPI00125EC910|nr:helix-turn-helix transcriptional regulator [Roseobacter sp. TSBP12]KAB6714309.1 XRE family transcriptional regulator [Roseobacter sp. TSBP12]